VWALTALAVLLLYLLRPHLVSDFHSRDLAQAGRLLHRDRRAEHPHRLHRPDLARHGALMAVGGYTTARSVVHEHWRDVWTIRSPGSRPGVVGFLIGLPALRLSGIYLALATFAFAVRDALAADEVLRADGRRPGPAAARAGPAAGTGLSGTVHDLRPLDDAEPLPVLPDLGHRPRRLRDRLADRAAAARPTFRAVRDSEIAAASAGIDLARTKTLAFAISGVYAGVAGALLAIQAEIVNPLSFTFLLSILLLVGDGRRRARLAPGMVLGRFFVQYLPDVSTHVSTQAGRARLRLRRRDHRRDDPAADGAGGLLRGLPDR
jgi:branched-chain amino acid transport system permease protein